MRTLCPPQSPQHAPSPDALTRTCHRASQAELASLGGLDASAALLVGGVSDEQLAACAELTQFAAQLDDHGEGHSSSGGAAASSGGGDGGHDADVEGDEAEEKKKPRERGTAWTEEEHKLFLQGLEKFGKGDWRSISRQCVLTRNPAQVASHAQKYFIRQEGGGKEKPGKRVSIHDISSLEQSMPARNQRKRRKQDKLEAAAAAAAEAEAAAAAGGSADGAAPSAAAPAAASKPAKKTAAAKKAAAAAAAAAPAAAAPLQAGAGSSADGVAASATVVQQIPVWLSTSTQPTPADGAQLAAAMAAAAAAGQQIQLVPMPLNAAFQLAAAQAAGQTAAKTAALTAASGGVTPAAAAVTATATAATATATATATAATAAPLQWEPVKQLTSP